MSALSDEIATIIAHEGPITLERYMSLALAHPRYGYYVTRDPFGAAGDFITAPEISQMFGELVGLWLTEAWRAAGSPSNAHLVELGPGRGTLMADVLRVGQVSAPFLDSVDIHMIETSPALEAIQRRTLARAPRPIAWSRDFSQTPRGPVFVLANEFFDALPVRHFVRGARGWSERLIGLDARGALAFGAAHEVEPDIYVPAEFGAVIEVAAIAQRLMVEIANRIVQDGGAMLIVDYGYLETSLGETLQAVKNHAYVHPLADPGEADLTTHVDFAALARASLSCGAKILGPITQGAFLRQLGIAQRAEALSRRATLEQQADLQAAFQRLAGSGDPRETMGDLFKAMAVTHPDMYDLPGFFPDI
jgi:NADH dehydrogenase [ubiquinone] 1 alpha subcomplex assembly factor 7